MTRLATKLLAATMTLTFAAAAIAPVEAGEVIKVAAREPGANPVGTWQTEAGDARFKVSLCGDGTQLCAKLTWLRKDARNPDNLRYLNKYVVQGALAVESNKWRGTVNYNGEAISGSVTLVGDVMSLQGCKGIFCQSMRFQRL